MRNVISTLAVLFMFCFTKTFAQTQHFTVKRTSFSSGIDDEFSPVYYKKGIVYCSNLRLNSLVSFSDGKNRLFKLFYIIPKGRNGWKSPKLFSRELITDSNDGPATFNITGNIIYYSRNNFVNFRLRNISDSTNNMGIYSAELKNGKFTNITPFKYNNPLYSFCAPALSADGQRIYFSSDMPGGYGGFDLYYCNRRNNDWDPPVNLGSVINSPKNESFPYMSGNGDLYFASDGLKGYGGLDIFYTREINGKWETPVHLDSAINTPFDDFGLIIDSTGLNGFFSSNRRHTDDIYSFSSVPLQIENCKDIKENNYCFTFYDERYQHNDSIKVSYLWDFGDGIIQNGIEVKHCFPGPGTYSVKLKIIDEITGKPILAMDQYNVDLNNIEQGYINSMNFGLKDNSLIFDGLQSNLKGCSITDYKWNFGEGFKTGRSIMNHTFHKPGDYTVQMAISGKNDSLNSYFQTCVTRHISIYDKFSELKFKKDSDKYLPGMTVNESNIQILNPRFYILNDLTKQQNQEIIESLNKNINGKIIFDRYEINPLSFELLNSIAGVLKSDTTIKLEICVNSKENNIPEKKMNNSERLAQALAFYLKNKDISLNAFHAKGFEHNMVDIGSFFYRILSYDNVIGFYFMSNKEIKE